MEPRAGSCKTVGWKKNAHKHAAEAEANAATAAVAGKWKPERKRKRAKVRERGTARESRPGSAACPWSLINAACLAGKSLCLVRSTCNCHADSWLAIPLYLASPLPLYPHPFQGSPVENFLCMAASWKLISTSQYAARFALLLQIQQVVLICNSMRGRKKERLSPTAHMRNILCRLYSAYEAHWLYQLSTASCSSGLIKLKIAQ